MQGNHEGTRTYPVKNRHLNIHQNDIRLYVCRVCEVVEGLLSIPYCSYAESQLFDRLQRYLLVDVTGRTISKSIPSQFRAAYLSSTTSTSTLFLSVSDRLFRWSDKLELSTEESESPRIADPLPSFGVNGGV